MSRAGAAPIRPGAAPVRGRARPARRDRRTGRPVARRGDGGGAARRRADRRRSRGRRGRAVAIAVWRRRRSSASCRTKPRHPRARPDDVIRTDMKPAAPGGGRSKLIGRNVRLAPGSARFDVSGRVRPAARCRRTARCPDTGLELQRVARIYSAWTRGNHRSRMRRPLCREGRCRRPPSAHWPRPPPGALPALPRPLSRRRNCTVAAGSIRSVMATGKRTAGRPTSDCEDEQSALLSCICCNTAYDCIARLG